MRALFALYVIAEIMIFIALGSWIGYGTTILIHLGLSVVALLLSNIQIQRQSRRMREVADDVRESLQQGGTEPVNISGINPTVSVQVWLGAILVAIPGFLTTIPGFLFLIPWTRSWVNRKIGQAILASVQNTFNINFGPAVNRPHGDTGDSDNEEPSTYGWGDVIDHRSNEYPHNNQSTDQEGPQK